MIKVLFALLCIFNCVFGTTITSTILFGTSLPTGAGTITLSGSFFAAINADGIAHFTTSSFGSLSAALISEQVFVFQQGSNAFNGLIIDAGVATNFAINSATTIGTSATAAGTTTLSVGNEAVVNVTDTLTVNGNAIIDGTMNVASSVSVSGNVTTDSSASSTSSNINVASSASFTVKGDVQVYSNIYIAAQGTFNFVSYFATEGNTTIYGAITAANNDAVFYQQQGTLAIQGSAAVLTSASVHLQNSAYFVGTGKISGSLYVDDSATVSVGNSPGTAYVTGDYHMSSTSTYYCDADSNTDYDVLVVSGTAYLSGIAVLNTENNYEPSGKVVYTTITYSNGVSGSFNVVRGNHASDYTSYSAVYTTTNTQIVHNSAVAAAFSATLLLISIVVSLM